MADNNQQEKRALLPAAVLIIAVVIILCLVGAIVVTFLEAPWPEEAGIITPRDNVTVLAGSPVQILSAHPAGRACPGIIPGFAATKLDGLCRNFFGTPDSDISRVELRVAERPDILQAVAPEEGIALHQFTPDSAGTFTAQIIAYDRNNQKQSELQTRINAIPGPPPAPEPVSRAVSLLFVTEPGQEEFAPAPPPDSFRSLPQLSAPAECPAIETAQIQGAPAGYIPQMDSEGNISPELKQQPLTINWAADNADTAVIEVETPDGRRIPFDASNTYLAGPGTYHIRLKAQNQACSQQYYDIPVVVPTPTPPAPPTEEPPPPPPTPTPFFPPPPPMPGVPPGPTQAQLPKLTPPVCDAAEYLGVFTAGDSTERRIFIPHDDQVPARVVAGSILHRAWRLRNIGTCTWGPGYELAFYGGRAMGSGGVAFESIYPADPGRRNTLVDNNRLIVPEGKPNQIAVVEVLLNAPSIPGIHQSYWRMRNPQGVYFGPIVGVTLEVVRDCRPEPGGPVIYGAPVINKFEIIGVGDVFRPNTPKQVQAVFGQTVTLEWDVINADNFDIILKNPLGDISTLSNTDPNGRAQFRASELGEYTITIYADNGACSYSDSVTVDVIPPEDEQFNLDLILAPSSAAANSANPAISASSTLSTGDITARWRHYDQETDKFTLYAQLYRRTFELKCPLFDSIFGWKGHCYEDWSDWTPVGDKKVIEVGGEGDAQSSRTVPSLESSLCRPSTEKEQYGIKYVVRAEKDGLPARPEFSNTVDTLCAAAPGNQQPKLPLEIEGNFNP